MKTMMKTIVFAILLSVSSLIWAVNLENFPSEKDKAAAKSNVQFKMSYPAEAFELGIEGFVLVSLEFDGSNVQILGINGSDEILIDYVKNFVYKNKNFFSTKKGEQVYRFNFSII